MSSEDFPQLNFTSLETGEEQEIPNMSLVNIRVVLLCPSSGPSKYLFAECVGTKDESDCAAAGGGHFVHDAQHLHHHVRTSETSFLSAPTVSMDAG